MNHTPDQVTPFPTRDQPFTAALNQEMGCRQASLVAAAIAVGRLPKQPAAILQAGQRPWFLARLFGPRLSNPLAGSRLEVIRAISAWLTSGLGIIRADLVTVASYVGWSHNDLRTFFPTALLRLAS